MAKYFCHTSNEFFLPGEHVQSKMSISDLKNKSLWFDGKIKKFVILVNKNSKITELKFENNDEFKDNFYKVGLKAKVLNFKEENGEFIVDYVIEDRVKITKLFFEQVKKEVLIYAEAKTVKINSRFGDQEVTIQKNGIYVNLYDNFINLLEQLHSKKILNDEFLKFKAMVDSKNWTEFKALDYYLDYFAKTLELSNNEKKEYVFLNWIDEKFTFIKTIISNKLKTSFLEKIKDIEDKTDIKQNKATEINERNIDIEIDKQMKKNLDKQQLEFILREKMRVIRQKLGEENDHEDKLNNELIKPETDNKYPKEVIQAIKKETKKLRGMMSSSPEANISKTYLDLIHTLPWRIVSLDDLDLQKAEEILSNKHYGLDDVKERVMDFLSVLTYKKQKNKELNREDLKILPNQTEAIDLNLFKENAFDDVSNNMPILTLLGPPGTGKTSIVKSIAKAVGRKMVKVSLGGVRDEAEIRGHRRTYVGAMPGKIINAIKKAGVSNPIILLDEIDKLSSDHKGDPSSSLLEVLDPEQNKHFQDHYLELEYDLSKVMFIATANSFSDIPEPLADRVEIIELSSYTLLEKIEIAISHLIPKVLEENLLEEKYFKINKKTVEYLISHYTREAGVRNLKRVLDKLARKIINRILKKEITKNFTITKEKISEMLGVEKYSEENEKIKNQIGIVNGLAYTAYGGSTLAIEVTTMPAQNNTIKLTGRLRDVMKESAEIALSYVRANAKEFGITEFDFEKNQIHIHVPEGAVPKDGPSAGVTFTTAIISALSKRKVSSDIGMTGEITLRGKVLAIGGLKEKSIAGYKKGIKTIFIPKENEKNLVDISDEIKKAVKFIPVDYYQEIFNYLFKDKK
ncbi:endopeptidase La [Mesomycoplasma neurolyticum]|uniref:Lon protease n=1 Tax=Mesomycoplasma neurolyticum TaxID=2120 RepID=A0A449A5D4_9BACT|nr:endopeptidase La [Mesomycoplasma neurolyticum]VEU59363.1 ATP-dependent protease La [Mesomycoplasma neurolyticum]